MHFYISLPALFGTNGLCVRGAKPGEGACRGVKLAQDFQANTPAPAKMKDFNAYLQNVGSKRPDVLALKAEIEEFSSAFPMPGL